MKSKSIKLFWIVLIVLIIVLAVFVFKNNKKEEIIPKCIDCNIILIDIDGMRPDNLGVYGYHRNTSPNIDAFAKKSILFKNAYSQSWITADSLKSFFISFLPRFWISKQDLTLPKILKKQDYVTAAFTEDLLFDINLLGFDTTVVSGPIFRFNGPFPGGWTFNETNKTLNYGLDYIKKNKNKKFFLYLHGYTLHYPYHSRYEDYFDPDYNQDIDYIYQKYFYMVTNSSNKNESHNYYNDPKKSFFKPEEINHIIAHYDGGILSDDELLGSFFNELDKTGVLNKTIIVLFSNRGEDLFENQRLIHFYASYFTTHVPLIIYIPGAEPKSIDAPVALMDIMPTILNLVDIKTNISMQGVNLVPIIENPKSADKSRTILGDSYIIKENLRLLLYPTIQLVDLRYDRNESNNLAYEKQDKVKELINEYNDFTIKSYLKGDG